MHMAEIDVQELRRIAEDKARELAQELVCPHCGSTLVEFVDFVADPGEEKQAEHQVAGGGVGAILGGVAGWGLGGPVGSTILAGVGAAVGNALAGELPAKAPAEYRCQDCGHQFERRVTIEIDNQ